MRGEAGLERDGTNAGVVVTFGWAASADALADSCASAASVAAAKTQIGRQQLGGWRRRRGAGCDVN